MKRRKNGVKQDTNLYERDVNENILNIITPSGIDFDRSHINVSENVGTIFCISKYPSDAGYGWLAPICNLEGSSTLIEYRYTSPDRLAKQLNKRISELKDNLETAKQESEKQSISNAVENLRELVNKIIVKGEPVGYVNIMIYITAENQQELQSRIKRIQSAVSVVECGVRTLIYKQDMAFKSMAPYGIPNYEMVSNVGERPMPISTLMGGYASASSGLNDVGGYYLGKTREQNLVILNQWVRNKDRTNSNWIVTGVPGVGKSTALKDIFFKEYSLGTKIIIFDPEREYADIAKNEYIHGDVIDCASGITGRINPLQIRVGQKITKEDLEEGETLTDYYGEHIGSDLALYLQQLRLFFALYFGKDEFNSEIRTILEQTLIELYNRFHITWETDVSGLHNEDYPIMEDLYNLSKELADEETNEYIKGLRDKLTLKLYSCGKGADQFIWNGYTTLNPQSNFINLDVSNLQESDDNVKRAQYYNLTMWGWQQMSRDRHEKVLFGVDEGYLFVDPENPDLMKFLRNISKRARKYEGGLMFITHSVVDILDPAVKRYGQAIIDNACYKFIMGTDGKNLKETQGLFNLSDKEVSVLSSKSRGQGVFMCGNMRINLTLEIADEILAMFGNAGGR